MATYEPPFPLWILIHRGESTWRPVMQTPGLVVGFSDHIRAGAFVSAASNPAWEVRLVVRVTWAGLVESFQRQGASAITIDPGADGAGTLVAFQTIDA